MDEAYLIGYSWRMDSAASILRYARLRAGLSQAALAAATGTSQATISAYENGTKEPAVATLSRLLAATGMRLAAEPSADTMVAPSPAELRRRGRVLVDVLDLAASLPSRHDLDTRYPVLKRGA